MRNFNERKQEIFLRSKKRIAEQKKRVKLLFACIPLVICIAASSVVLLPQLITDNQSDAKEWVDFEDPDGQLFDEDCISSNLQDGGYSFDPEKYTIVSEEHAGDTHVPNDLLDLEKFVKTGRSNDEIGVIFECYVAGESQNFASDDEYEAYVLTPVRISKMFYCSDGTTFNVGDKVDIKEPFFYVTKNTPSLLEIYGEDSVVAYEYTPMKKGEKYMVFGCCRKENIIHSFGVNKGIYCVSDNKTGHVPDDAIWHEIQDKYYK